jgi:predicted dehydrogenase
MTRRQTLALPAAAAALNAAPPKRYRAALIGHTGHGDYGHGWETTWKGFPNVEVVAVADPVEEGRKRALERSGARKGYASYREMLAAEKPDIVNICPRWLDQRVPMVQAAAETGAHILLEKPFAANLKDGDTMLKLAEKHRIKIQVGHTARPMAVTLKVREMLRSGEFGMLQEMHARGKEDRRAGGEDLIVLGTHCFDLMRFFAGDPQWVSASITEKGVPARAGAMRKPTEPIGDIAGDQITATFGFRGGVPGHFGSKANDVPKSDRFGVTLCCSKAMVFVPLNDVPGAAPYLLRQERWAGGQWERIEYPAKDVLTDRQKVNAVMGRDLIDAIEKDREPICSGRDGHWAIEMVAAIYQSHYAAARLPLPLATRS